MKNENYFMDQRSVPAFRWDGKDDKIPSELLGTWKLLDFGNIVFRGNKQMMMKRTVLLIRFLMGISFFG